MSSPFEDFALIRGLALKILRPHPDMTAPKAAEGDSDWATHVTITHVAELHTGQPTVVRPLGAWVPNSSTLRIPNVPLYWLTRRSPGQVTWALIPALDSSASPQQIEQHVRRWTGGGNYACTQLSGLRELMGDDYFYGAIAIHDQPHWNAEPPGTGTQPGQAKRHAMDTEAAEPNGGNSIPATRPIAAGRGTSQQLICVLEFGYDGRDNPYTPTVVLADSPRQARLAAIAEVIRYTQSIVGNPDAEAMATAITEFLATTPVPEPDAADEELERWLESWHQSLESPWFTLNPNVIDART